MSRKLAAVLAGAVLLACTSAPPARATYPGRDGTLSYQLETQWVAGNQGSCDDCAGGLSAIFGLDARLAGVGFDRCLYASRLLKHCASGSPLTGCVWGSGSDGMCVPLHPSFSPDGRRLVFTLSGVGTCAYYDNGCEPPPGAPHMIVLANADGTQPVALARLTGSDDQPAFLPSGRQLVFAGRPAGAGGQLGPRQLFTVDTDGSGLTQLTTIGASEPAPCTDGAIVFVHAANLYLLGTAGTRVRRLTWAGGGQPDCAPNSREVAFARDRDVYVVSLSTGRVRRLTVGHRVVGGPVFSPSDEQIAFITAIPTRTGADCIPGTTAILYLERIDLRGDTLGAPRRVADDGVDDGDCGGHFTAAGALAWQPRPAGAPAP